MSMWLLVLSFTLIPFRIVKSTNITVDDANPLWTYNGQWNVRGPGVDCSGCQANLDTTQVYNQTWHDVSQDGSATASITFTGKSVSVYAVLTWNRLPFLEHYTFSLNGVPSTPFLFTDSNPPGQYTYNTLIFSNSSLDPNASTQLTIGIVYSGDQGLTSDLLLDYMVYDDGLSGSSPPLPSTSSLSTGSSSTAHVPSTSLATSSSPTSSSTPASSTSPFPIAAVVVPTTIVSILLALIAYFLWRRTNGPSVRGRYLRNWHPKPVLEVELHPPAPNFVNPVQPSRISNTGYPSGTLPNMSAVNSVHQPQMSNVAGMSSDMLLSSSLQLPQRSPSVGHDLVLPPSYEQIQAQAPPARARPRK